MKYFINKQATILLIFVVILGFSVQKTYSQSFFNQTTKKFTQGIHTTEIYIPDSNVDLKIKFACQNCTIDFYFTNLSLIDTSFDVVLQNSLVQKTNIDSVDVIVPIAHNGTWNLIWINNDEMEKSVLLEDISVATQGIQVSQIVNLLFILALVLGPFIYYSKKRKK